VGEGAGVDFYEIQREAVEELESSPDPEAMFDVSLEHLEIETRGRDVSAAVYRWLQVTLPRARAFVRPGLDEPEEVARLEVEEGRSESRQN
jgi:hypothetical protein